MTARCGGSSRKPTTLGTERTGDRRQVRGLGSGRSALEECTRRSPVGEFHGFDAFELGLKFDFAETMCFRCLVDSFFAIVM